MNQHSNRNKTYKNSKKKVQKIIKKRLKIMWFQKNLEVEQLNSLQNNSKNQ